MGDIGKDALRLIRSIYDAALDSQQWPSVLEALAYALGGHSALLRLVDYGHRQVGLFVTSGSDERYQLAYREHFIQLDPYRDILESLPLGAVRSASQVASLPQRRKTEYFNDYELPQDKVYALGSTLHKGKDFHLQLGIHRGERAGDFGRHELDLLDLVLPHIARSVQIGLLLGEAAFRQELAEAALDDLRIGVILADAAAKPLYLNREAESLAAAGGRLKIGADGLRLHHPMDTVQLHKLITAATLTTAGKGTAPGGVIHCACADCKETLQIWVTPVSRRNLPSDFFAPAACAAVFLALQGALNLPWRMAAAHFGLTPAEARLAVALADGLSVEEAAAQLTVAVHTARSQLKAIFAKTGVHRQSELVALLLKGILAHCRMNPDYSSTKKTNS